MSAYQDKPAVALDLSFDPDETSALKRSCARYFETLNIASFFNDDKWEEAVRGEQVLSRRLAFYRLEHRWLSLSTTCQFDGISFRYR